jgi:predicted phosphodiesterase
MKYAVLSDIHANIEAFTEVLKKVDQLQVDKIVCLGDTIGYYANPNECLQMIQERNVPSVAGNHDRAGTGLKEPIPGCPVAGQRAIAWTRPHLTPENRNFLDQLPLLRVVDGLFLMVHGSLYPEPNEEIYLHSNPEILQKNFEALTKNEANVRIGFFGHTHLGVVHQNREKSVWMMEPGDVQLDSASAYLINPGSVGQSRDSDPRASFLTYDTSQETVSFYRVEYNRTACLKKARREGLLYEGSPLRQFAIRIVEALGIKETLKKMLGKE